MKKLSYVDALRGYAIMGVLLVHIFGFTAGAMGTKLFKKLVQVVLK